MSGLPARWVVPFALGALPLVLWGFFASAAANRPLFALWGALAVGAWAWALRVSLDRGWSTPRRTAVLCLVAAACVAVLAALLVPWAEDLALGLAAVAPALPAGSLSSPSATLAAAALLALGALGAYGLARRREATP